MARDYSKTGSSKLNKILRILLVILVVALVIFTVKSYLTQLAEEYYNSGEEIDVPITDTGDGGGTDGGESTPPDQSGQTNGEGAQGNAGQSGDAQGSTGQSGGDTQSGAGQENPGGLTVDENKTYNSKDEVALYIHLFGHLPSNYITKKQAQKLGWENGSLEKYAPGKSIGGDTFGNYEGLLPKGKKYTECDIDTKGKSKRGAKRIVFSDDGCVYYTEDHYESFELLYGEE